MKNPSLDLMKEVPENEIRQIKKEFITDRIRQSIDAWDKQPNLLANIIINATMRLALLISKVLTATWELKNKLFHEALEKEYGCKAIIKTSSGSMDLQRCRISTQYSIPHSMPRTHIRKNVTNGKKPTERKPLQKPNPCTKRYNDIKKRLTGRTPANLTKAEIKGRDDRPFR